MAAYDDPGLAAPEREAVVRLLREQGARAPDEFGFYALAFADGGEADLQANGLKAGATVNGCSVQTRSLTSDLVAFLFRLSREGNMILIPVAEGNDWLATSEQQQRQVVSCFPVAKVVRSVAALETELRTAFEAWQRYRDQVIPGEE